jgi:hypothetical protein
VAEREGAAVVLAETVLTVVVEDAAEVGEDAAEVGEDAAEVGEEAAEVGEEAGVETDGATVLVDCAVVRRAAGTAVVVVVWREVPSAVVVRVLARAGVAAVPEVECGAATVLEADAALVCVGTRVSVGGEEAERASGSHQPGPTTTVSVITALRQVMSNRRQVVFMASGGPPVCVALPDYGFSFSERLWAPLVALVFPPACSFNVLLMRLSAEVDGSAVCLDPLF